VHSCGEGSSGKEVCLKGPGKEDVVGVMGDDDCCGTYASGSSWKLYTNVQGIQQGLRFSVALIQLSLQYLRREAGQKFREGQATMQEKWRELNGRRLERLGQALGEKEKILDEKKERLNAWHQNLGDWHRDLEGWNKTDGADAAFGRGRSFYEVFLYCNRCFQG